MLRSDWGGAINLDWIYCAFWVIWSEPYKKLSSCHVEPNLRPIPQRTSWWHDCSWHSFSERKLYHILLSQYSWNKTVTVRCHRLDCFFCVKLCDILCLQDCLYVRPTTLYSILIKLTKLQYSGWISGSSVCLFFVKLKSLYWFLRFSWWFFPIPNPFSSL